MGDAKRRGAKAPEAPAAVPVMKEAADKKVAPEDLSEFPITAIEAGFAKKCHEARVKAREDASRIVQAAEQEFQDAVTQIVEAVNARRGVKIPTDVQSLFGGDSPVFREASWKKNTITVLTPQKEKAAPKEVEGNGKPPIPMNRLPAEQAK